MSEPLPFKNFGGACILKSIEMRPEPALRLAMRVPQGRVKVERDARDSIHVSIPVGCMEPEEFFELVDGLVFLRDHWKEGGW